jgi:hypothetical protein
MKLLGRLCAYAVWGAIIDLIIFGSSFGFFGGAHGPVGPMIVLTVFNAPVRAVAIRIWPMERSSPNFDIVLAFAVVVVNGAIYGLLAGPIISWWRRRRVSQHAQANAK